MVYSYTIQLHAFAMHFSFSRVRKINDVLLENRHVRHFTAMVWNEIITNESEHENDHLAKLKMIILNKRKNINFQKWDNSGIK